MTGECECPGMTGERAFLAMPAKLLAGHEPRIRRCERSVAIHVFSWRAQMDRHGLRPRDDERERVPWDDGRVCVPRDDERERLPRDDGRVCVPRDDERERLPRDDERVCVSSDAGEAAYGL